MNLAKTSTKQCILHSISSYEEIVLKIKGKKEEMALWATKNQPHGTELHAEW